MEKAGVVVSYSGGMDSTALISELLALGYSPELISFDYGQTLVRELDCAKAVAEYYGLRWDRVDMRGIAPLLKSALTGHSEVPDGVSTESGTSSTVVPARNAVMLSICAGTAFSRGHRHIAYAAHGWDHKVYPDCRPAFAESFEAMATLAVGEPMHVLAPFINIPKSQIVTIGTKNGAPFGLSWSCYNGHDLHCGTCEACVCRKDAFSEAGIPDPTKYEVK